MFSGQMQTQSMKLVMHIFLKRRGICLLYTSISRAHVEKPSDALSVGQEITAKVVDLNEAEKKISLSMKALEPETVEAEEETAE